jgi:hypothetical protein
LRIPQQIDFNTSKRVPERCLCYACAMPYRVESRYNAG